MDSRYLFRGKRLDNGGWATGYYELCAHCLGTIEEEVYSTIRPFCGLSYKVDPSTIGQCTNLSAAKSYRGDGVDDLLMFEGDVITYTSYADNKYQGIVRIGEYEQDGSGDEYGARSCYGAFVERTKWTCLDWQDPEDEEYCCPEYLRTESLLVIDNIEIIGTIHDADTQEGAKP